jgi:hypothetical protein
MATSRHQPAGRPGAILFVVLVCIIIASLVFMSLVLQTVAERRRGRTEAWQTQAAWLVESGLERAAARLAGDPGYAGETWRLPADALAGPDSAVVLIEVEPMAEQPRRRLVRVRADYPDHPQQRARQSKQVVIQAGPTS